MKNEFKRIFLFFIFLVIPFFLCKNFFKSERSIFESPLSSKTFSLISPTPTPKKVTLAFAGEMIFARTVATKINEYKDYKHPFYKVEPILKKADLRFATLEAPLLGVNIPCPHGCMVFVCDEENIEGLKFADINVVSLAANHIMDGGNQGLEKTLEILDKNNISHTGAGINIDKARAPVIKEINGIKLGFLAYNKVPPKDYGALENKPGSAWLEKNHLVNDVGNLEKEVDIVIVSFHWGTEYTAKPDYDQVYFAHLAIDNGADLIIGSHPHWIQSIEFYKEKPIFYSLGNFIFDQMWSEETQKGIIVLITYQEKKLEKIEIAPFKIYDYVQPAPVEGEEREKVINYVLSISDRESQIILNKFLFNN